MTGHPPSGRTTVLIVPSGLIPPAIIGVLRPLSSLEPGIAVRLALPSSWTVQDLVAADVVVLSRNNDDRSVELVHEAQARAIPVVYEIDDDFFELPRDLPGTAGLTSARSLRNVLTMLRAADRVHTYSALMVERLAGLGIAAHRAPVYFDHDLVADVVPVRDDIERVVFASGRIDEPQLDAMLVDVVDELLTRRPEVEVHLWRDPGVLTGRRGVVRHPPGVVYSEFVRELARLGAQVGLAPLSSSTYYQAKTNNKFREYSGCGIAGVYSDVPVYRECVEDGVTGLLVANTAEAWVAATERLLDSADLRRAVAASAADVSRREYARDMSTGFWADTLATLRVTGGRRGAPVRVREPAGIVATPSSSGTIALARDVVHVGGVLRGPVVASAAVGAVHVASVRVPTDAGAIALGTEALVVDATALPNAELMPLVERLPPHSLLVVSSGCADLVDVPVRDHPWSPVMGAIAGRRVVLADSDHASTGVDSWGYALGAAYDLARAQLPVEAAPPSQPLTVRGVVLAAQGVSIAKAMVGRVATLARQPTAVSRALLRSRRIARQAPRRWNDEGLRDL